MESKSSDIPNEIDVPLRRWRVRVLNVMLIVGCLAGLPAIALVTFDFIRSPQDWSALVLIVLYLLLVGLIILRRLDPRARAWGLLLLFYAIGIISYGRGGLVGVGRQYLLVLPILAILLVGPRSGMLMTGVSLLTMVAFAGLAHWGLLAGWLIDKENPLTLYAWVSEQTYTAILMILVVVLLTLFYRLQLRTLERQGRTAAELERAQARLQEQNQTLEERVAQRTAEKDRLYHQVEREKQYFESLVQNSPTAIIVVNREARVEVWNPAAEQLFGYTGTEAAGRNVDDLVAKDDTVRAQAAAFSDEAAQGALLRVITRRSRKDGTLVDVELLTVPIVVEGQQMAILAIYHDISELQRARQAAEEATQAKSTFLATMSHEIRTPMNAVIGMTGLLLDTPLTAEQKEFAETIRTSGDALLTIINDILDFSKIEAGRMDLECQPFLLGECVESAVDLLASRAAEKGLNLACVVDPHVPAAILGDVTRVRQVLVNLVSNAVKFTEQGEVVVSVTCDGERDASKDQGPGDWASATLHFSVRDTGIGIPADRLNRLFESFSQVDASTTRRFGGTGLGLAISKRLVELMGGTLTVESEGTPGRGSTFTFTLPAEAASVPAVRPYLRGSQPGLEGKRVLIVDDNPTNRRILYLQTQSWGMHPHETGSPAEALGWLRRGDPFDVAFLDMQMLEMDGLTLAGEIRRLRAPSTLPLVMLSSLGKREAQADRAEWAAFLLKPIKASQLYDALASIFETGAGSAARETTGTSGANTAGPGTPLIDPGLGQRHPLRILLAEDNLVNQKLALRLLTRMGYRADLAANGIEALQSLRRQPYDVVLMDIQMPEMDGLEATRAIWRDWPAQQRPRIIAMTANVMQEDREQCLAAGMEDFIAKPIRVDQLVAALRRCQPLARPTSPAATAPAATN